MVEARWDCVTDSGEKRDSALRPSPKRPTKYTKHVAKAWRSWSHFSFTHAKHPLLLVEPLDCTAATSSALARRSVELLGGKMCVGQMVRIK